MSDQPDETPQPAYAEDDLDVETIIEDINFYRRICWNLLRLLDGIHIHLQKTDPHVIFKSAVRSYIDRLKEMQISKHSLW